MRALGRSLCFVGLGLVACAGKERDESAAAASVTAPAPAPSDEPAPARSAEPTADKDPAPSKAESVPESSEPRVYAKSRFVWIFDQPGANHWVGYLWLGGSAKLREDRKVAAGGCTAWVPIEPRGWVCADGVRATTDAKDPAVAVVRKYGPRLDTPWPHEYGESRGLQRYKSLPTEAEQRGREWDLKDQLERVAQARSGGERHASLEGVSLDPAPEVPIELGTLPNTAHEPRSKLNPLSTVTWIAETRTSNRDFLLTGDLMWVPKDRVSLYPKVTFQGVHLDDKKRLPLATFRSKDRPRYEKRGDEMVAAGAPFKRLSWVELSGKSETVGDEKYLELRDGSAWIKASEAVVPTPQEKTPWGAPVGGDDTDASPPGRKTWLEASVWDGWLIAYEGTKPVFVTMIAPGRGGTPVPGKPAIDTASTPTGTFKITGKFATATMEAPGEFIHTDVPWTQNFSGPHALHGAYWHDDWGNRKSGGCVNVSPIDGKFLYEWTEPPMPAGWHGVKWRPSAEPATTFVVHR